MNEREYENPETAHPHGTAEYDQAVTEFGLAVQQMQRGEYDGARVQFERIGATIPDEPALAERCRTYVRICEQRSTPVAAPGTDADSRYLTAIMKSNKGDSDAAIAELSDLMRNDPSAVHHVYARACAYALKGNAEAAIGDLRQAITLDPSSRFHAVNDPDFEQIREEPSFIDIIEPTPTGV
jgi:tetratricopeptide (TPR) repeat protein